MGILEEESLTVTGLSALAGDKSVVLFWDVAKDSEGNKIAKYEVSYGKKSVKRGEASSYEKTISVEDTKSLTIGTARSLIENLENENVYYFAVKAIDSKGEKSPEYSEEILSIPTGASESSPQVESANAITSNIVKVIFSKKIVLPEEKPELAFEIREKDNSEEELTIKRAFYKTNYFLDVEKEKDLFVQSDQILYLETEEKQQKGLEYTIIVSSIVVDENKKSINSASTDSADFIGTDVTEIPESEKPEKTSPSPSATPTPTSIPTPTPVVLAPNEKLVPEGQGESLSFFDGEVTLQFTKNSKEGIVRIEKSTGTPPSFVLKDSKFERKIIPLLYEISFKDEDKKRTFSTNLTITPSSSDITKAKITPSELSVFYYDETKKVWENAKGKVSKDEKSISVSTDHFSQWVIGSEVELHAVAEDKTPPEEVTNFTLSIKASVENFLINLSWKKSLNSAGDLAVQMLYKSLDNGKTWDKGQEINKDNTKFTLTGEPEKEYSLKITTKDKSGNESAGVIKTIKLPALPASGAPLLLVLGSSLFLAGVYRMRKREKK